MNGLPTVTLCTENKGDPLIATPTHQAIEEKLVLRAGAIKRDDAEFKGTD
jgi:hypothetical protein